MEGVDFGALFTQSVRQMVPLARRKGVPTMLDYRGPLVWLDADDERLRRALHRLFCGALDALTEGCVFFSADVAPEGGQFRLSLTAVCSGTAAPPSAVAALLQRLGLDDAGPPVGGSAGSLSAQGVCPVSNGTVSFIGMPNEGAILRLQLQMPGRLHDQQLDDVDARGARVWLIGDSSASFGSLQRRLQRLGWSTQGYASVQAAQQRLDSLPADAARPALVVAYESASITFERVRRLHAALPGRTQTVLATELGSPTRALHADEVDVQVCAWPFAPADLREFTLRLDPHALPPSGETRPAPLAFAGRKRALVVDDNEVNQEVASALLEHLGLEVERAGGGVEAIERCMRRPPDLVLMDVQMPDIDGIESTRRLRRLQRDGVLPPFAIVAATAGATPASEDACRAAGMDGHLVKPLTVPGIQAELLRLMPT